MRRFMRAVPLGLALTMPTPLLTQAIHLSPMYVNPVPVGTLLLKIRTTDDTSFPTTSTVTIEDDQLLLFVSGTGGPEEYALANRTLNQLAAAIRERHPAAVIEVRYPTQPAVILKSRSDPAPLSTDPLVAGGSRPMVAVGFGAVFSMTAGERASTEGLLAQTGFQLDLVGRYRLQGARKRMRFAATDVGRRDRPRRYTSAQVRLGLSSDQSLNVVTEEMEEASASSSIEAAIVQADAIALTGQLEFAFPFQAGAVELALVPVYGVSWARLIPFEFPQIDSVLGEPRSAEVLFSADVLAAAKRDLDRTLPLSEGGLIVIFRFLRDDRMAFYTGGGVVSREVVQRDFSYRRSSLPADSGEVDDESLRAEVRTDGEWFWRGVFGARIGEFVDLKLDALGPIGNRDIGAVGRKQSLEPILRVVLGAAFPVGK